MGFKEKYGEWCVIMGASMGIGAACAREFAARGINCVLVARSADKLVDLAAELEVKYPVQAKAVPLDLLEPDAYDMLDAALEGLDVGSVVWRLTNTFSASSSCDIPDSVRRLRIVLPISTWTSLLASGFHPSMPE